jgi:hypothetical protein
MRRSDRDREGLIRRTRRQQDAVELIEPHGVRGGVTPNERREFAQAEVQARWCAERWAA